MKTKMCSTSETRSDFWNDSCDLKELSEAIEQGAVGATSNPVIVYTVAKNNPDITDKLLDCFIASNPEASEDDIAWRLIKEMGKSAAALLEPAFNESGGTKGRLSLQVNPKFYRNAEKMVEHGRELAETAPNIAIKLPAVKAGIKAMEELTALGITVTATVCFTVAQAVACAEAMEKGLTRAKASGINTDNLSPWVAIMVGRTDDHLKRVMASEKIVVDPGCLEWAGVAVFKKAYKIYKEKGFKSTLMAAAYRNHMHWSEFLGGDVVLSMPYKWWNLFNGSEIEVKDRMSNPVSPEILENLGKFDEFKKSYDEDGMAVEDFVRYGGSVHTLNQFVQGYHSLLDLVREKMLG